MRIAALVTSLTTTLALVTGCTAAVSEAPSSGATASARSLVPAKIRSAGTIKVGHFPVFEPIVYLDGGKPAGFDVELANAIADRLGLRVEFAQVAWEKLRGEVTGGRLDLVMSSMTDTAKRQQEVDFVDYLNVGSSIVASKRVTGGNDLAGLCGYRVAVIPESIYQDLATSQAERCPAGRRLKLVLDSESEAAVLAGRADAFLHDYPIAVVSAKKHPELRIMGDQIEAAPFGIAVAKDQTGLRAAVQAALYELFQNGTYDALLKKWGIAEGSLKTGAINGGA